MHQLNHIVQLFSSGSPLSFEQNENQDLYVLIAVISSAFPPNAGSLHNCLAEIPTQDEVEVIFGGDFQDVSLRERTQEACVTFAGEVAAALELNRTLSDSDGVDFKVTVTVTKGRTADCLSLYSLDSFARFLDGLDIVQKFSVFRNILANGVVTFHCFDAADAFETKTIHAATNRALSGGVDRKELIEKRDEICHFRNGTEHHFIPEDFHLLRRSRSQAFNSIMDCLCFIVSIVYLSDISDIDGNTLTIRLNGYKVISQKVDFSAPFHNSLMEVYKLYNWAYSGGNVSDKIGIVRNLISLYAKDSILNVEEGVFSAARSNYEIYLKENIGRYLEIKNNIANKILEMSQNCSKATETFGSYFKQSIFAVSSFFITIVVLAAVDKEKYGKVFSQDIKHVSLGLILISFIHMIFTILEFQSKCERFHKEYYYLKDSYKDVLDTKDLDRIFESDKKFREDYSYLQSELVKYFYSWIIILIVLLIITFTATAV